MKRSSRQGWRPVAVFVVMGLVAFGLSLQGAPAADEDATSIKRDGSARDGSFVSGALSTATIGDLVSKSKRIEENNAARKRGSLLASHSKSQFGPGPIEGINRGDPDQDLRVFRARAISRVVATSAARAAGGNVSLGGSCSCDTECVEASGPCQVTFCNNSRACEEKDAEANSICENDDNICTQERCGSGQNAGACVALMDGAIFGAERLSACAKACQGGTNAGLDCDTAGDCPGEVAACKQRDGVVCDPGAAPQTQCTLDTGEGRCCDPAGVCSRTTEANCASGLFRAFTGEDADSSDTCDASLGCPQYSSGIAPRGDELVSVGRIVASPSRCLGSIVSGNNPPARLCEEAPKDCPKRCSSGPDAGDFCVVDADCSGGASCGDDQCVDVAANCHAEFLQIGDDYSLSNGGSIALKEFRFIGGVETPNKNLVFEFWDASVDPPVFANAFVVNIARAGTFLQTVQIDCFPDCRQDEADNGNGLEVPNNPLLIIPGKGWVVMRSTRAPGGTPEDPNFSIGHWVTTDAVDVPSAGGNDPGAMWVKLTPDDPGPTTSLPAGVAQGILAFEIVGEVLDTKGACCDPLTGACEDIEEWNCRECGTEQTPPGTQCRQRRDSCAIIDFCTSPAWKGARSRDEVINESGLDCASGVCNEGACCAADGTCTLTEPAACTGDFAGGGTNCEPNCCDQPATGGDCCGDLLLCTNGGSQHCDGNQAPCAQNSDCPGGEACIPVIEGTCVTNANCDPDRGRCDDGKICSVAVQDCGDESACDTSGANANICTMCPGVTIQDLIVPSFLLQPDDPAATFVLDISGDSRTTGAFGFEEGDTCASPTDPGHYEAFRITGHCEVNPLDTGGPPCEVDADCAAGETCMGNCGVVTVSTCCSDPLLSPVNTFVSNITGNFCPCTIDTPFIGVDQDSDGNGRGGFPGNPNGCNHDSGPNAQPCCADQNASWQFTLPAGTFMYQISRGTFCENSIISCDEDSDCPGGQRCIVEGQRYGAHITVTACKPAACCLNIPCETDADCDFPLSTCNVAQGLCNSGCLQLNKLDCEDLGICAGNGELCIQRANGGDGNCSDDSECEAAGGNFLGDRDQPVPICSPTGNEAQNICSLGSCCLGPGECDDGEFLRTLDGCLGDNPANQYIGGAECTDNPCPICPIRNAGNCHEFSFPPARFLLISDRSLDPVVRAVDNITPAGSELEEVCWFPCFGPAGTAACFANPPPDDWRMVVYEDDFGLPGMEVCGTAGCDPNEAGQQLNVVAKEPVPQIICFIYSALLASPVLVTPGDCYWTEITGLGTGNDASPFCFIGVAESVGEGDGVSLSDDDGVFGPEDMNIFRGLDATDPLSSAADVTFCVSTGLAQPGCGVPATGPCCRCGDPSTCSLETAVDCLGIVNDDSGYLANFDASAGACDQVTCPGIPANDLCADSQEVFAGDPCTAKACVGGGSDGQTCVDDAGCPGGTCGRGACSMPFDTRCASTDGRADTCYIGPGIDDIGDDFVNDVWFTYNATESGVMTLDTCGSNYESLLAVYGGTSATCECPTDNSTLILCDDNNINIGPDGQDFFDPPPSGCPDPLRVPIDLNAGFEGAVVRTNVIAGRCYTIRVGGERGANSGRWGTSNSLHLHVLASAAEAPLPAAAPHDRRKNRVISINPNNVGPIALRVELLDKACRASGAKCTNDVDCDQDEACDEQSPPVMLGWVGDPITLGAASALPAGSTVSRVVKDMPDPRVWTETIVHVSDCEIAPAQSYGISASPDGLSFSVRLDIGTIKKPGAKSWGDYVGTVALGVFTPPNGILNVDDLSALLLFFRGATVSDPEYVVTTLELAGQITTFVISASDLGEWLRAFGGGTYPPPSFLDNPTPNPANCP